MGERVSHLLNERLLDFIAFGNEFAIARLIAPEPIVGLPLVTSECRRKYDVTVVGVKRMGEDFIHAALIPSFPPTTYWWSRAGFALSRNSPQCDGAGSHAALQVPGGWTRPIACISVACATITTSQCDAAPSVWRAESR
jgi:hypothetical protein